MPIELVTAWLMLVVLGIYTLLGGADFGAGVWDLLASGPHKRRQRELLAHAIGPIWEANHVWLIALVVLLFTGFPRAFSAIMTALHVPITLALLGIVARGASFVFRTYTPGAVHEAAAPGDVPRDAAPPPRSSGAASPDAVRSERAQLRWGLVFSVASVATPVLLGVTLGTIASGRLRWENGIYVSGFFAPWLTPFPWFVGLFTLAIFAFLAAVYMCAEAPRDEPGLAETFRRRALASGVAVGLTAAPTWLLAYTGAEELSRGLAASWWTVPLQMATGAAAVGALWTLWSRRYLTARAFAVVQISLIVLGYGAALFPYLVVREITIASAAAPPQTHRLLLGAFGVGAILLLPSLYVLFRIFKGQRAFQLLDKP